MTWHRVFIAPEEDDSGKKIAIEPVEPSIDVKNGQKVWVKTIDEKHEMWILRPIKRVFESDNGSRGFEVEYRTDQNKVQYSVKDYKNFWYYEKDAFDRGNDIDPPRKDEKIQLQFKGAWCDAIVTKADETQTQSFTAKYDPKPTEMKETNAQKNITI